MYVVTSLGFGLYVCALVWIVRSFITESRIRGRPKLQSIAPFIMRLISYALIVSGFVAWICLVLPAPVLALVKI